MNYAKLFVIGFVRSLVVLALLLIWSAGMLWPFVMLAPEGSLKVLPVIWATAWLVTTIYAWIMSE